MDHSQPPSCSLRSQLENTLRSFECNEDIPSKQDACVLFTMQLIYGTLHQIPLEQLWKTMRLCIYYHQISSIHETIFDHLSDAPEEEQHCAELYDLSDDRWTTNAKAVFASMDNTLSKLNAVEFNNEIYSTSLPALLKDESQDEQIRLATKYISITLVDLMTTEDQTRKLSETQNKLLKELVKEHPEEEAAMIWEILTSEKPQGCPSTVISDLLNIQTTVLQEKLSKPRDNDDTESQGSTECNCQKCQSNNVQ